MRARGKEVYIITGVLVVVVCVAGYLLLYHPLRKDIGSLSTQVDETQQQISAATADLARLHSYEETSPQTRADLLRLNKMLPSQAGIPSIIIELTRTAEESGLDFISIQPGQVMAGQPFSVQSITLTYEGQYFDLEDFLFRLESYVEYRNNAFLVTGRLLQVSSMTIGRGSEESGGALAISLTVNCYLWSVQQASTANTTPSAPLPTASPSPSLTASPSPGATTGTPSPGVNPTDTSTATPSTTSGGTPSSSGATPSTGATSAVP